jgi:hydroxyacylglutathione hydrolase
MLRAMHVRSFTGGIFDTNCFLVECPGGNLLIDAPQDAADWLRKEQIRVDYLLLTHGHFDHIIDAAAIASAHKCPVAVHPDSAPMLSDRSFFQRFGFQLEVQPVEPKILLQEGPAQEILGAKFDLLLVPGHCPGSICVFDRVNRVLFGGDVLFAGGIGRWDLPGGDRDLLLDGIFTKVLPFGDDVTVLPGHGPATTIGQERQTNPFLTAR